MANEQTTKAEKPKKRGFGRRIKDVFSELKKVTWPSFGKVVKQTAIVIAVVLFFLLVIMGMDALLGWLYNIFKQNLADGTASVSIANMVKSVSMGIGIL